MTKIIILGTAQDGGVPHLFCECTHCLLASKNNSEKKYVSSISIDDVESIIVDATPDIDAQFRLVKKKFGKYPSAIILTHLHIGHYVGLLQLGREVASSSHFKVYCTESVKQFLLRVKPFSYLTDRGQISLKSFSIRKPILIGETIITPMQVRHRNEDGDTIGIRISNRQTGKYALYIPDVDDLDDQLLKEMKNSDVNLFDGTFFTKDDIKSQTSVPHPAIRESMTKLMDYASKTVFIHLNHNNPAYLDNSEERKQMNLLGFDIAKRQQIYEF